MANIKLEIETLNPKTTVKLDIEEGYYEPQQIAELFGAMVKVLEVTQEDIRLRDNLDYVKAPIDLNPTD